MRTFLDAFEAARKKNAHHVRHVGAVVACLFVLVLALNLTTAPQQSNAPVTYRKSSPLVRKVATYKESSPSRINASLVDDQTLYDAWIYPDAPGALAALQDGRHIFALKAEFLHINDDGTLQEYDQSAEYPNGYSPANVALMSRYSTEQYVTVSGDMAGTELAMQNADQTIRTMAAMANKAASGIELDWEEFGQWTPEYYQEYLHFLGQLETALHVNGHQLMVDGPPIYDATSQGWYQWKYQEVAPLVDSAVMMIYDNEYDTGVGNSIAPQDWSLACMKWLKNTAGGKGVAGIAAYGYVGRRTSGRIAVNTSTFVARGALGTSFMRNADGELVGWSNDTFYDYSDQKTMDIRLAEVQQAGIDHLSVWSVGDNPWF